MEEILVDNIMDPSAISTPSSTGGYPVNFLQHHHQQQQQHQHQQPSPYGQQFHFAPAVVPSFPQAKPPSQPPSFGAVPFSQSGAPPGGAIMPTAGFPQHSSAGPHATFTAPFAQPPVPSTMNHFLPPQATSTPTPTLPTTAAQTFPQNMASISANNMVGVPPQQQQQQQRPVQQPQQHPAQPQQAQGQTQPQQGQPTPGQGTPQMTPQSGPAAAREKARVSVLLDINSMLLQEVVNLQAAGKAGAPPQQQQPQQPGSQESNPSPGSDQGSEGGPKGPAQKPSPEYIGCMRRLQANLAYLATIADRAKKSGGVPPPAPAIMTPPPNMPSMGEVYNKLNELFPRPSVGTPQPSPQSNQGNGKPSPSPASESVV